MAPKEGPKHEGGAWLNTHPRLRSALGVLSFEEEAMWHIARLYCADVGNDGRLAAAQTHVAAARKISESKALKLMGALVVHGFVETDSTTDGDFFVFDWSDQPTAAIWNDPIKRARWARDKRLKRDTELCERIKLRDNHRCRYCGIRVRWKDHSGPRGGTYDHVDPDGDNSFDNVVVSCRGCNLQFKHSKLDRTPEQWIADEPLRGRTLKRPGTTEEQAEAIDSARRERTGVAPP